MCDTSSWLCILSMLGPIVGALSLFAAAIVAWRTFIVVQKRTADITWIDSFHKLYSEFWKDKEIEKVRLWIVSEDEYAAIAPILEERLRNDKNILDSAANSKIESIDQFCALLTKLQHFGSLEISRRHIDPWKDVYASFWIGKINKRDALVKYINAFWKRLELHKEEKPLVPIYKWKIEVRAVRFELTIARHGQEKTLSGESPPTTSTL